MTSQLSNPELIQNLQPVICGGDILAYSYIRDFWKNYKIKPIVLSGANIKATSSSKFCDYRTLTRIDEDDYLINYLLDLGKELNEKGKKGILLGSGDWYARIFSKNKAKLKKFFYVPYIDFQLLDKLTQKDYFYAVCEELSIPIPKTFLFSCKKGEGNSEAALNFAKDVGFPCIAKPSNSAHWHYAELPRKKKIYEVETAQELELILSRVVDSSYDDYFVLQEFIPGDDDSLRSVTLFSDSNGECKVSAMGQVALQDHAPSALGNPVVILDNYNESIIREAAKFLKHFSYEGFSNFDVKFDSRDGQFKFFEINTRPGRNSFYLNLAGANLTKILVDYYVLGKEPPVLKAKNPFLFCCVPHLVIKKTIQDETVKEKISHRIKEGLSTFPYFYKADCWSQKFWAVLVYLNQIPKFKKYVWDVSSHK